MNVFDRRKNSTNNLDVLLFNRKNQNHQKINHDIKNLGFGQVWKGSSSSGRIFAAVVVFALKIEYWYGLDHFTLGCFK